MSSPRERVLRPARALLRERGWRKAPGPGHVYLQPLGPGVRAWLSLAGRWSIEHQHLDLTPGLGVRHDAAEDRAGDLWRDEPGTSAAPTLVGSLPSLVPGRRGTDAWRLSGDEDHDAATWETLLTDLDEHAWPWWRERASDEQVVDAIRRGEGNDTAPMVLPVLLMDLGRADEARAALEAGRGRRYGLVVDYDAFAARLLSAWDD